MIGRSEKRFARDAAHVQAGAAQFLVFFDEGSLQSKLASTDRGDVSAGTRAMITTSNFSMTIFCHSDRSEAKWRNLSLLKDKEQEMSRLRST